MRKPDSRRKSQEILYCPRCGMMIRRTIDGVKTRECACGKRRPRDGDEKAVS